MTNRFLGGLMAVCLLASCGGSGGGGGGLLGVLDYAPIYRDTPEGTLIEEAEATDRSLRNAGSSTGHGATGVIAMATILDGAPSIHSFNVRLSADRQTLTLSIDGMSDIVLAADGTPGTYAGFWGDLHSAEWVSLMHFASLGEISFTDATDPMSFTSGSGHYGLETPLSRLPAGSAVYDGDWTAMSYVDNTSRTDIAAVNGTFLMTVNFDTGALSGTTGGTLTMNATTVPGTGAITGDLVGNGLVGTMTLAGGGFAADADFAGKTYGWDPDHVAGALTGTFSGGGETMPVYGEFEGEVTP